MKNILLSMDKQISFNLDDVSVCLYLGSVWTDVADTLLIQIKSVTKIAIFCFGSSKFNVDAGDGSHKPSACDSQIRALHPGHFSFRKALVVQVWSPTLNRKSRFIIELISNYKV